MYKFAATLSVDDVLDSFDTEIMDSFRDAKIEDLLADYGIEE